DVTERHHFNRCDLYQPEQVTLAVPAAADQANPPFLIGKFGGVVGNSREGERGGGARLEEFSAVHGLVLNRIEDKHKSSGPPPARIQESVSADVRRLCSIGFLQSEPPTPKMKSEKTLALIPVLQHGAR